MANKDQHQRPDKGKKSKLTAKEKKDKKREKKADKGKR